MSTEAISEFPNVPVGEMITSRRVLGWRLLRLLLRFARRQKLAAFGAVVFVLFLAVAVLAPLIAPYESNETNLLSRLKGPSAQHVFGTDNLGRDQLSRIIFGARTSLYVGLGATSLGVTMAVTLGMVTAYVGGWLDMLVQRIVEAWITFPNLILLLALVAVLGGGLIQIIAVLALGSGIGGIRTTRSLALTLKHTTYIEAARSVGASDARIIFRHILPNLFGPIMVFATLGFGGAILAEAGLSFLGFGIPPPTPSWGQMLSGAATGSNLYIAPWLTIFPGLAISLTIFAINMLGDGLRDELDPRLRGSR